MNQGSIRRSEQTERYTVVSNEIVRSQTLTLNERALLTYLLSLPRDWIVYKTILYKNFPMEKPGTIDSTFTKLQKKGYIVSKKIIGEDNKFTGWEHVVFDTPQSENTVSRHEDSPPLKPDFPTQEIPEVGEKGPLQSTNFIQSTNLKNIKGEKQENVKSDKTEILEKKQKHFYNDLKTFYLKNKDMCPAKMVADFYNYWAEPSKDGLKIRYDNERYFDFGRRLKTWLKRSDPLEISKMWEEQKLKEKHAKR